MDTEETQNIEKLLSADSTEAQQRAALTRMAELLEETYILNLPPSKTILKALQTYSKRSKSPAVLAKRAAKLQAKYKI